MDKPEKLKRAYLLRDVEMIRQVISTLPQGELNESSEKRGLPLIIAIRYRCLEAVTGLLEAGCDPDIASKAKCDGYRSAYSYAKTFFLDEYIALMEPYHVERVKYTPGPDRDFDIYGWLTDEILEEWGIPKNGRKQTRPRRR